MRRGLTWLAGLVGIAALLRRRSRRRAAETESTQPAPVVSPDPVVELRQKLDETRAAAPEPTSEAEATLSLDERRARVHERAQDAISLMDGPAHDPSADGPRDDEGDSR